MSLKTKLTEWQDREFEPKRTADNFSLIERITIKEKPLPIGGKNTFLIEEITMTFQRQGPNLKFIPTKEINRWKAELDKISEGHMIRFHFGDELISQSSRETEVTRARSILLTANFLRKTQIQEK